MDNEMKISFAYTRFCTSFGVPRVVCGRPSPLACALDRAAAIAVNAALVASQWQKETDIHVSLWA